MKNTSDQIIWQISINMFVHIEKQEYIDIFFKLHVQICVIVTPDNARAARAYLVRFCVDEVVELSLCLSVSASECPLVMVPCKCPFMKGPLLSFSAILLLLPLFYIRHGPVVLCMTENCSTWIHVQACVKAVNHAWKPIQEIGHFFYE